MLFYLLYVWALTGNGISQPAFIVMNSANENKVKTFADDSVLAFAQTPNGRVLFSPYGAFIGVAGHEGSMAVIQLGFGRLLHKNGIQPKMGTPGNGKVNFLSGPQNRWQQHVQTLRSLSYGQVWKGTELEFMTNGQNLEFLLTIQPGATLADIALSTGGNSLTVSNGQLVVELGGARLWLSKPNAYQWLDGARKKVDVSYKILEDGRFSFEFGNYHPKAPLMINPVINWSTFFGSQGGGSGIDSACALAVASNGEVIVAGRTYCGDFPTTAGVFDPSLNGDQDGFVLRLSSDGSTILFGTFIGSRLEDYIYDVSLDAEENILVAGYTYGGDFPTTENAYDTIATGQEGFLTKLSPDGTKVLFSTFLGGSSTDICRGVFTRPDGEITVFGTTQSVDFQTTMGAPSTKLNGTADGFLCRFSSDGQTLLYATLFGGDGYEFIRKAVQAPSGAIYFGGYTTSFSLPGMTGGFDTTYNGLSDQFVAVLSPDGTNFTHSTFLGGDQAEQLTGIGLDNMGNVLIGGYTSSADYPTTSGVIGPTLKGAADGVVVKLSMDLSTMIYGTFIGGSSTDYIYDLDVDASGLPVIGLGVNSYDFLGTPGSFGLTQNGQVDFYIAKLNSTGTDLEFGTFVGGSRVDLFCDLELDRFDQVFFAGSTSSLDFPATHSVPRLTTDAIVGKLSSDGAMLGFANVFGGGGGETLRGFTKDDEGNHLLFGKTESFTFPTTAGVFDQMALLAEGYISKLSSDGTELLTSTIIGGSGADEVFCATVDPLGNIIVAGSTSSSDFPTTPGAFSETIHGSLDIFVTKLDSELTTAIYSTYLGGTGSNDIVFGMVAGQAGSVYLTGHSYSNDFPVTPGAFDTIPTGLDNGFVTHLSSDGSALLYSTFIGDQGYDRAITIDVDSLGQVVVGGTTYGSFPVTQGAFDESFNGGIDVFVAKFSADGSDLIFGTYLGGNDLDLVFRIRYNAESEIIVAGAGGPGFPTTEGAFDDALGGESDGMIAVLSPDGSNLLYSTYVGGSDSDSVLDFEMDDFGNFALIGRTKSFDYPVTANALQKDFAGGFDTTINKFDCSLSNLIYGSYLGGALDDYGVAILGGVDDQITVAGFTDSSSFPVTERTFDPEFTPSREIFLTSLDFRNENIFSVTPSYAVQGLAPINLKANLDFCSDEPYGVQWVNENAGTNFPQNLNPVLLDPAPAGATYFRVDVINPETGQSGSAKALTLAAHNPDYFDFNGDGCNSMADILAMLDTWLTLVPEDPNGDGFIDVRDFLFINTSQEGNCP